jgi:putative nucleotidyltransferase with HDIG domain
MSRLEEVLLLIEHIPPFPKVAQRVMDLLADPNTTATQLAEVIQFDAAITANVLKICNAAYFGLPRKVSSLDEGLVVIGQDVLKDIIITSSSARFFKGKVGAGYDLGDGELWKHSVACGIMAKLLVSTVDSIDGSSVFTAALLHDIGKRFLSTFIADDFQKIVRLVQEENLTFEAAEHEIIGIDHAKLGGIIFQKWGFPTEMREAVENHHEPDALDQAELTALVALANAIVLSMGIGVGVNGLATEIDGNGLKRFGLDLDKIQLYMVDLLTEMEKAQELLNL